MSSLAIKPAPSRTVTSAAISPPSTSKKPNPPKPADSRPRDTFTPADAMASVVRGIVRAADQVVASVPKLKVPPATKNMRNTNAALPVDARLTNAPGKRSAENYNKVIDQFDVAKNPRYAKRNGNTYCNIFASDVTRAMGAEIPHYALNSQGKTVELDANATNKWLNGPAAKREGWRPVTAAEAQSYANKGIPAVASWYNKGSIGHIGVIRPERSTETITSRGPRMAQAGSTNFNSGHVKDGFGAQTPQYFVFDPPGTKSLDNGTPGRAKPI
jgi:hypothetical protein